MAKNRIIDGLKDAVRHARAQRSAQASSAPLPPDEMARMKRLAKKNPKIKPLPTRSARRSDGDNGG